MRNVWKWIVVTLMFPALGFGISRAWDYWDRHNEETNKAFKALDQRLDAIEKSNSKWEVLTDHENRIRELEPKSTFAYQVTVEFMKAVTYQRAPALMAPETTFRGEPPMEEDDPPEDEPNQMEQAPISPRALRERYEKK